MSHEILSVKGLRVRREILEGRYEPAVVLSNIVRGIAPKFLLDPTEFFKRTHVTDSMKTLIVKTLMGLLGKTRAEVGGRAYTMYSKLIILPSLYGGGKSHSLAVLYHLLDIIRNVESPDKARTIIKILDGEVAEFIYENWNELKGVGVKSVVVDCGSEQFAPVPEDEREVKTLWGYIAQQLGRYSVIARYDKNISPPKGALKEVLDNSGTVILIDEIARYYTRTKELDRSVINDFLMNLTEVLTTEEIRKCVVIITLPYDVEKGVVEEAHAEAMRPEVIKRIVDRVGSGNTVPVVTTADLPSILKKRIFEEDEKTLREYGRRIADKLFENASEVAREFIRKRGGVEWLREELERTYPFHPETINVLRILHTYLSKYLQATRNPIRMASEAVLAIRKGVYDWMGYAPYLVMPFHIPIVLERVLAEAFPLTFSEFRVFRSILEKDVAHPVREETEEVKLGDNIREKIPEDYHIPSFMITAYIWLRSLAGGGLVSNIEAYPSMEDVAWTMMDLETVGNKEWMDVARILRSLHGKLAYLAEHSGRWLFRRIPFLDQLIERYARDILPNVIYSELASYLNSLREISRSPYRIEVLRDAQYVFIKYGEEAKLPDDLSVNKPTIVIFAREASDDEVAKVLERNNVVVLRPDTTREISEEDLRARPELKKHRTYWEALKEVLRYLKACERISDEILRMEYAEEISRAEEVFALLRSKRDRYKSDYDELRSFLLPRVYHAVFLRRAGRLKMLEGLTIRSDAPLGYAIEVVLQNNNYLRKELKGIELEEIILSYLKVSIREKEDGVAISDIWNFFLTNNTVEEIPVLPFSALMNAIYDVVNSLDYGVKIDNNIYWKTVYKSKEEANAVLLMHSKDIGEDTVKTLRKLMALLQRTGRTARIVYWEFILDDWLEKLKPKEGYRIAVLTSSREVKTLEELKTEYNWEETLKDSVLFYEELKVEIGLELPEEVFVGEEFTATLKVVSRTYEGKVKVQIVSPEVIVSEKEFVSELPVEKVLTMKIPKEVAKEELSITVIVYSERGEELGRRTYILRVRRILPPPPPPPRREWLGKKSVLRLIEEGKLIAIYGVRSFHIGNLVVLSQLTSTIPSKLKLSVEVSNVGGIEDARAMFELDNLPVKKTSLVQATAIGVSRLGKVEETTIIVRFDESVGADDIAVGEFPDDVEFDVEYEVE